jgi:hypothetical protein
VRQLEDGERVSPSLCHNPIAYRLVNRSPQDRVQQHAGINVVETSDEQLREPAKFTFVSWLTHRDDQGNRLGEEAASHEGNRLGRDPVQPLSIVDDAEQRTFFGDLCQEAENSEPHQKSVWWVTCCQTKRGGQGTTLGLWKAIEMIKHWSAKLVEPRKGQFHL